jgi:hypothetical protein
MAWFVQRLCFVVIEIIGHATARIVLPLLTFGWVRAVPLSHQWVFEHFLLRRDSDGAFVVDWFIATLAGIVVWAAMLIVASRWGVLP